MHKIFIVTIGEPLPLRNSSMRLLRAGRLAEFLADRGFETIWLTSDFDHFTKSKIHAKDLKEKTNLDIKLVKTIPYRKNISLTRGLSHLFLSLKIFFILLFRNYDAVYFSFPPIDIVAFGLLAAKLKNKNNVVEIRDLWPDEFKRRLHPTYLNKLLFKGFKALKEMALRNTSHITCISDDYVEWVKEVNFKTKTPSINKNYLGYKNKFPSKNDFINYVDPKEKYLNSTQKINIWFIGTFSQSIALSQFKEIIKNSFIQQRFNFFLSGKGELFNQVYSDFNDIENVFFTGFLNEGEIHEFARSMHIGWLPYETNASMSVTNKFCEYLHYGLPILASVSGEAGQIIECNKLGWIYSSKSEQSFVDALNLISNNYNELSIIETREYYNLHFDDIMSLNKIRELLCLKK